MSFATASCDLWQNEQRRSSSDPERDFILSLTSPPTPSPLLPCSTDGRSPSKSQLARGFHRRGLVNDVVNYAVFLALFGIHNEVSFDIFLDLVQQLARVPRHYLVHQLTHADDLAGVNV